MWGGGVLIASDSTLKSEAILVEEFNNIEFICLRLSFPGSLICITCSYIPPASQFPEYLNHIFAIKPVSKNLSNRDQLVVLGDFKYLELRGPHIN